MALKDFTSGEVLTANDVDVYLVNTLYAEKTANESVSLSTTFQNDDHLFLSVAANSVYQLELVLFYEAATGGDIKFQFTGPAGFTYYSVTTRLISSAASSSDDVTDAVFDHLSGEQAGGLGAGVRCGFQSSGILTTVGTAGTLQLQWAQVASNATPSILLDKSFLVLRRTA